MDVTDRHTRRKFATMAAVAVVGLSGCTDDDDDPDTDEPETDSPDTDDSDTDDPDTDDPDGEEEYDFEDQPDDAAVTFELPTDGDTVQSPVELEISIEGAELVPAGENVVGAGHIHILVDHDFFERGEVIPGPSDSAREDGIYHWSDAQSEDTLELEPDEYTVGAQFGDGVHRAFGQTDEVTITVEE